MNADFWSTLNITCLTEFLKKYQSIFINRDFKAHLYVALDKGICQMAENANANWITLPAKDLRIPCPFRLSRFSVTLNILPKISGEQAVLSVLRQLFQSPDLKPSELLWQECKVWSSWPKLLQETSGNSSRKHIRMCTNSRTDKDSLVRKILGVTVSLQIITCVTLDLMW